MNKLRIKKARIINKIRYRDIEYEGVALTVSELGDIYYTDTFKKVPVTYGDNHYKGYLAIILNGKKVLVHRIIGATFYGLEKGYSYNHKDHNKKNNNINNLEKVKSSEHIKEHNKNWDIPRNKYAPLYAYKLKGHKCNLMELILKLMEAFIRSETMYQGSLLEYKDNYGYIAQLLDIEVELSKKLYKRLELRGVITKEIRGNEVHYRTVKEGTIWQATTRK